MSRLIAAFAAATLACLSASPAFAGAVSGYTGVDGFAPVPIPHGSTLVDLRVNSVYASPASGWALAPTLNVLHGIAENHEIGVGSWYDFGGVGTAAATNNPSVVYPWARGLLGTTGTGSRIGYMAGGDIALNGAYSSSVGLTILADHPWAGGLLGFMGGVRRYFDAAGTYRPSGNVNYTFTSGPWMLYAEVMGNLPVGAAPWDSALRGSVTYLFTSNFSADINPALTYSPAAGYAFNPNVGVSFMF